MPFNAASLLTRLFPADHRQPALQLLETGAIVPPPAEPPRSYEVRIRYSVGGTVSVVGHDGKGEPMMELRLAKRHLRPAMLKRMESWCRAHDDDPNLQIVR